MSEPMSRIGRELHLTLQAAVREAMVRRHAYVTIEHLLYALIHDESGADILSHAGAELPRLKAGGGAEDALKGVRPVFRSEAGARIDYPVYDRSRLGAGATIAGPAIVEEPSSTSVFHAGDRLSVGPFGELVIETQ